MKKYFYDRVRENPELSKLLISARIQKTAREYLAEAYMYALVSAILGVILGFMIYQILLKYTIEQSLNVVSTINIPHPSLPSVPNIVFGIVFSIVFGLILGYLVYQIYLFYPKMKADDRRREIDRYLPHAIHYMYSLSKGGVEILDIFRAITRHRDVYGAVVDEFQAVVNMIDLAKIPFKEALYRVYETTPSMTMKEFISGLITTVESGGDLTGFFALKCEQLAERSRAEIKRYLDLLGILAEGYVTVAVAFPLFLLVLQCVMLVMGTAKLTDVYALEFIMLPALNVVFATILYFYTPKSVKTLMKLTERKEKGELKDESELYTKFVRAMRRIERREKLKYPVKAMIQNPYYAFVLSIPISLILFITLRNTIRLDILAVTCALVSLVPVGIFAEYRKYIVSIVKNQLPEILKGLASVTVTGAEFQRAIEVVSESGKGYLYDDLKRVRRSIRWNIPITDALRMIPTRYGINTLARVFAIITDVLQIGGDVTEALHACSRDTELERNLENEKKLHMGAYIFVIYMAYIVFVGIIYVLMVKMFPQFYSMKTGGSLFSVHIPKSMLILILSLAMTIQAIGSGIVAGMMSEESALGGIKHISLMLLIELFLLMLIRV